MRRTAAALGVAVLMAASVACGQERAGEGRHEEAARNAPRAAGEGERVTLSLTSPAFENGGTIPARYTCSGENVSPALDWSGPPAGARAFALVMDDPDAPRGTFDHWLIYDLPADATGLPEAIAGRPVLDEPAGARQGRNGFGDVGYGGPCPPPGAPHHYVFRLHALDAPLGLDAGASRDDLEAALRGHVLATARLSGRFGR